MLTVYAGCATKRSSEVVDLVVAEMRRLKRDARAPADELRRAKDHLKGSLMLSLESTSSRMSHLARQEIYFDRHFTLDEMLAGIERVSVDDVQRVAARPVLQDAIGVRSVVNRARPHATADQRWPPDGLISR